MDKINIVESPAFVLPTENMDTDQIIPAQFLKGTVRDGLGKAAFFSLRYHANGTEKTESPFKQRIKGSEILVSGKNFGCGSSREHAVWALADFGFKVVISSYFADIFKNNALNNGLLPITVSSAFVSELMDTLTKEPNTNIQVNLEKQTVKNLLTESMESFEINPFKKECIIKGYSPLDYLLSIKDDIKSFETANGK